LRQDRHPIALDDALLAQKQDHGVDLGPQIAVGQRFAVNSGEGRPPGVKPAGLIYHAFEGEVGGIGHTFSRLLY